MRNSSEIQLIGYVYQDAKRPNESAYPNWVVFKVSVNRKYKNKAGGEKQDTSWYECKTNSEGMAKRSLSYVKDKCGILVKGIPKVKPYLSKTGTAEGNIEVLVNDFTILTYPKGSEDTIKVISPDNDSSDDIPF